MLKKTAVRTCVGSVTSESEELSRVTWKRPPARSVKVAVASPDVWVCESPGLRVIVGNAAIAGPTQSATAKIARMSGYLLFMMFPLFGLENLLG
jgi:hypothetical protein